ncbi:MAG: helix-turn-helix domain-containing protein [Monoglobaceae bacterium]
MYNGAASEKTCHMLSSSTIPIGEIANSMGFCDSHYFSTWFKQQCGTTPRDYRKTHNA